MLRFRGNWVECSQPARFTDTGVAGAAGQTSLALVVWDYSYLTRASISAAKVTAGSLIAGDNQLTGNSSVVALVALVSVVTVTGNQVIQDETDSYSLAVVGTSAAVAITGNVLVGTPLIPATWLPMNAVLG